MSNEQSSFEDLVDFYDQWPTIRDQVKTLSQGDTLTGEQAQILRLVFQIVDCVGPQDLTLEPRDTR